MCTSSSPSPPPATHTQQTIDIALRGRQVSVLVEPGFDELRVGDLDSGPIEIYWSWKNQHSLRDRPPPGESRADALCRYANALRRLLARTETVTLAVIHELGLRYIVTAAADASRWPDMAFANAIPFLFDEYAVRRAASLGAMACPRSSSPVITPGQLPGRSRSARAAAT